MGSYFGDNEVEKPLSSCSKTDTIRAETGWEDLDRRSMLARIPKIYKTADTSSLDILRQGKPKVSDPKMLNIQ